MAEFGLGRKPHVETPRAARLYNAHHLPREAWDKPHRWWWQDGAWLDQGATGTCVGHAFAHRRSDGPTRVEGVTHNYAMQLYLDASGDSTYQEGTYAIEACRVLAARNEISTYHWVTSPEELQTTLLERGSVCVGTNWYYDMFYPEARNDNMYLRVSGQYAGGHEYVLNGIDTDPSDGKPFYRMKNSWGIGWGKHGTARILKEDMDDLIFAQGGDAVLIKEVRSNV